MLRLWEAIGWPESADGKGGPLTRYGVSSAVSPALEKY